MSNEITMKQFLLTAIQNDKANLQFLKDCLTDVKYKKREDCSAVTFLTKEITPTDVVNNTGKRGFILWIDLDDVNKINSGEIK